MSAALGGSRASSASDSKDYGSNVWGTQSPYLADLYARSKGAMGQFNQAGLDQGLQQGQGYLNQAGGALDASQQGFAAMAGDQSVDPMLGAYGNAMQRNWSQNIMPGIQGQAAMAGGLGNSRYGIAAGQAGNQQQQQFQDFAAQLYGGQQDRRLQAMQGMQVNAAGYGALGEAQGGYAGMTASSPFFGASQYAGLLGAPVIRDLGGMSTSRSKNNSFNISGGLT